MVEHFSLMLGGDLIMSDNQGDVQLGLYLRKDNLKIIEVETSGPQQFRINKIIQTKLDTPLNTDTLADSAKLDELGKQLLQIVEGYNLNTKYGIFTLESPITLVKKIPYDEDLSEEDLINQVDWEVKEFSYSPEDEYIVDFQKLKTTLKRQLNEMVVISVRESVVSHLKRLFSQSKIKVKVIDLDIFAAIRAIKANYDFKSDFVEIQSNRPQLIKNCK